jgi:hypothetical protein
VGLEISPKIGGHALATALSNFGMIKFTFAGKQFEFNADGTLNILSNGDFLYESNGGIYYEAAGGKFRGPPVLNTAKLPAFSDLPASINAKVVVSEWVLSSAIWAMAESNLFDIEITPADLPAGLPIKLSTDNIFFKGMMPGLAKYPHMNLTLSVSPTTPWPAVQILTNQTIVAGPLSFSVAFNIVNGNTPVLPEAVVVNIKMTLTVTAKVSLSGKTKIVGEATITKEADEESIISTKIGDIDLKTFKSIIELAFGFLKLPTISFPLPDGLELSSLHLTTVPGFLEVTTNVTSTL